jgi:hypothetical protein
LESRYVNWSAAARWDWTLTPAVAEVNHLRLMVTEAQVRDLAIHRNRLLLRARDAIDARYPEPLDIATIARASSLSAARAMIPSCVLRAWGRPKSRSFREV